MSVQFNNNNSGTNISFNKLAGEYKLKTKHMVKKNIKALPSLTPLILVSTIKTNPKTLADFGSGLFNLPFKITGMFLAAKGISKLAMLKIKAKKYYLSKKNKELNANPAIVVGSELALTLGLYSLGKQAIIQAGNALKKIKPIGAMSFNSQNAVNKSVFNTKIYKPVAEKITKLFTEHPKLKQPILTIMTIGALTAAFYKPAKLTMEFFKSKNEDANNAKQNIKELMELRKKYNTPQNDIRKS